MINLFSAQELLRVYRTSSPAKKTWQNDKKQGSRASILPPDRNYDGLDSKQKEAGHSSQYAMMKTKLRIQLGMTSIFMKQKITQNICSNPSVTLGISQHIFMTTIVQDRRILSTSILTQHPSSKPLTPSSITT